MKMMKMVKKRGNYILVAAGKEGKSRCVSVFFSPSSLDKKLFRLLLRQSVRIKVRFGSVQSRIIKKTVSIGK